MTARALAAAAGWLALCAATPADANVGKDPSWRNVTAGGPLRPGIYGRIEVRGNTLPPLVHATPVVASRLPAPDAKPVVLYVPPGQLRRWPQHCAKWDACERPVFFVRVDDSPSRLGEWKRNQRAGTEGAGVLHALNRAAP